MRTLRNIYESCSFALIVIDPENFDEAQQHDEWRNAMKEELQSMEKNKT